MLLESEVTLEMEVHTVLWYVRQCWEIPHHYLAPHILAYSWSAHKGSLRVPETC